LNSEPAHFIAGEWRTASDTLPVVDPTTGETVAKIGRGNEADVDAAVSAAEHALSSDDWRSLGPVGREQLLRRLADLIERDAERLAGLETLDNGMLGQMARHMNVPATVDVFRYFAGWPTKIAGGTFEVSSPPVMSQHWGLTMRRPVGVVGAIIPWNVPLMMAAWKLAPALAAGCTIVLKPSEEASLSSLALADLTREAGFPAGVINVVTGLGMEAGRALVEHPQVAKISFNGSTVTGRDIAGVAAKSLKPVSLELGGKSPTIIFADSNLDRAVVAAASSIFMNAGQVCVAGSRLYVERSIYDKVLGRLREHLPSIVVGPGSDPRSQMGPVISAKQRSRILNFLSNAHSDGCTLIKGHAPQGPGFYVAPTVVAGAAHRAAITQEEVFGPVLCAYPFEDEAEAIRLANGTSYGLAAYVWTRDIARALRMADALQCGKICINSGGFPYPGLPEGGMKGSGTGRDLGREAVEQCLATQTLLIAKD
jgi:phenylacetaldehyde dehydrogenase